MVALEQQAIDEGYRVFFLTGRPEAQRPGTGANLADAGYAAPDSDHLFMRNRKSPPSHLPASRRAPRSSTSL